MPRLRPKRTSRRPPKLRRMPCKPRSRPLRQPHQSPTPSLPQRPKPSWQRPKVKQSRPLQRAKASPQLPRNQRRASDMELQVTTLEGKKAGSVTVSDAIFGLEPRADIIHRCVVWQLAKRQRGTHEVKNRAEITRTGKKMYRQKGTGSARHGSARVNLFRGGGRSFGPHT